MKRFFLIVAMAFCLTMVSGAFIEIKAQRTVVVEHKKGWSHRKKYGVIGAGAGAVTGALVSKHHARGALIGGAVGGAIRVRYETVKRAAAVTQGGRRDKARRVCRVGNADDAMLPLKRCAQVMRQLD